jgi:hypothetical protein
MLKKKLVFVLLATGLASCSDTKTDVQSTHLAANDFESVDGWTENVPVSSLTKENAHSGQYSVKVSPGLQYSRGYHNTLSKLSSSELKKIKVRAWVNLSFGATSTLLVTAIEDPSNPSAKPVLWEGMKLADEVKTPGKWTEVEKIVTLPENVSSSYRFNVYLWSTGAKETVFLDDLTIDKAE